MQLAVAPAMGDNGVMFTDQPAVTDPTRRRWRFWLLLIGGPLLVLALSGVGWVIRANSGLQSAIAEADRLDPRWRLEEIEADRATPPARENGADKIAAMRRLSPGRSWWTNTKYDLIRIGDLQPEHRLDDQQIAALNDVLAPLGPALVEARSLVDTPRGRHPITYTPDWISTNLTVVQTTREAAALLKLDVIVKVEAGDFDGAVRSCHAMFHAGCSVGDEPAMIAQLVRAACQAIAIDLLERTLAQCEPSDAVLAALQARLEATEPEPLLLYGLRGERAGGSQFFENVRNGSVPVNNLAALFGQNQDPGLEVMLRVPGFITTQQTEHLGFMNELVAMAKLPPEQWSGPLAVQKAKENQLSGLVPMMVGGDMKMTHWFQRNHASLRCAIVAIAAERYRRAHGQWPARPDDLVKAGLLKSVPNDPYAAGQSIKFARPSDGLIVYTTGPDATDDGGKLVPSDRAAQKPGSDLGFRLWDVATRRQPPLPVKP